LRPHIRLALLAFGVPLTAVVLGGIYAYIRRGGTAELPGFLLWSLPLGLTIALFGRKPRFVRVGRFTRLVATTAAGVLAAIGWTLVGWALIGGFMLNWDFPVLYCWALAGAGGTLVAALSHGLLSIPAVASGVTAVLSLAIGLWMYATRPRPAVLIVYHDHPKYDAAQRVLDSVLTKPHYTGQGRDTRWPTTSYTRKRLPNGQTAALIGFRKASIADSIRVALHGHPLVERVIDTTIARR
jgi:hypothetical protein